MAVTVKLIDGGSVTHATATKWIADPAGNLVIVQPPGTKATHIYAATAWDSATVTA